MLNNHRDSFARRTPTFVISRAHDDKLWVATPGLKFAHSRGASLNDLEPFDVLVPVSVGCTYDILGLLIRGFKVPRRNFPVAGGQDAVKVLFHHGRKLLERRQTAPFQGSDLFPEELHCPCSGREVPEVVEGLLENIGLKEPRADDKKLREGFFRLWLEVRPPAPGARISFPRDTP